MANYPRTEAQMVKRFESNMARISRNAHKIKLMDRCDDLRAPRELSDVVGKDYCDVSRGETPSSVREKESDLNSKEEAEKFKAELGYANRLNYVEDRTGLTISRSKEGREILDGGFEKALIKADRLFDVSKKNLKEIRFEDIGSNAGQYDAKGTMSFPDKGSVDPGTVYHEFAHAEMQGWGRFDKVKRIGRDNDNSSYRPYVELCADVIATERVGINRETRNIVSRSIKSSEEVDADLAMNSVSRGGMTSFDEVCFDRAHAQIYGNHETLNLIDNKLKSDYDIDVFGGGIGRKIANVTNMFVENAFLSGSDKLRNFEKIGQAVYDLKATKFDPPDTWD